MLQKKYDKLHKKNRIFCTIQEKYGKIKKNLEIFKPSCYYIIRVRLIRVFMTVFRFWNTDIFVAGHK